MPDQETDYRSQKALLYPFVRYDDLGQPTVSAVPVELKVRWDPTGGQEVKDPKGNSISSEATVVVDRDVAIGSIMWLGSLSDLPGTGDNVPADDLMQVISSGATPDIKGRAFYREVGLMRWNDTIPLAE